MSLEGTGFRIVSVFLLHEGVLIQIEEGSVTVNLVGES